MSHDSIILMYYARSVFGQADQMGDFKLFSPFELTWPTSNDRLSTHLVHFLPQLSPIVLT